MVRGRPQDGYTMVVLVIAVVILNIAVAAVLPMWSTAMQREREEELIFRGLQYAEAIRVFQRRFGRLPVRLEELMEVEPRSIRQLWTDPMSGKLDWGVIVNLGGRGGVALPTGGSPQDTGDSPGTGLPTSPGAPGSPLGPISGVYSRSKEASIKVFLDQSTYDQWKFDVQLLLHPAVGGALGQHVPRLNAQWIGRPFRVPPPGTLGQGSGPGGGGGPGGGPRGDGKPNLGGQPDG